VRSPRDHEHQARSERLARVVFRENVLVSEGDRFGERRLRRDRRALVEIPECHN